MINVVFRMKNLTIQYNTWAYTKRHKCIDIGALQVMFNEFYTNYLTPVTFTLCILALTRGGESA